MSSEGCGTGQSKLGEKLAAVMNTSSAAKEKLKSRGKMLARDRLSCLCDPDPGSILELSPLAADGLHDGRFPSAGLVTAVARVCGVWCAVIINEGATMGGTWIGLSCEKALRLQEIAMKLGLPTLYIVDSGGAFLHTQAETFPEKFGRIFANEAKMSAQGRPQLAAVVGMSTAGGAYIPAMCDEIVMCETNGTIYLAGPPLVRAATGEVVTAQDLGGAVVHTTTSGVSDQMSPLPEGHQGPVPLHVEQAAIAMLRRLTEVHCQRFKSAVPVELESVGRAEHSPRNAKELLDQLLAKGFQDGFKEFMPTTGRSLLIGFGQLTASGGHIALIVGCTDDLSAEDARKGVRFLKVLNKKNSRLRHHCLVVVHAKEVANEDDRASAEFYRKLHLLKAPKIAIVTGNQFIKSASRSRRSGTVGL
ncbi:hypothetical protein FOZ61_000849 [Perkinsus olseni]|uniref:methylcrotonoyl-CoA carboxylase n=1 Tax=Perkinsus olseni TaxID=32597 RepID=A0A7J6LYL0_PEROL|nr:hypothetical protein FOZ61_000849 [Perkinsus olseni]